MAVNSNVDSTTPVLEVWLISSHSQRENYQLRCVEITMHVNPSGRRKLKSVIVSLHFWKNRGHHKENFYLLKKRGGVCLFFYLIFVFVFFVVFFFPTPLRRLKKAQECFLFVSRVLLFITRCHTISAAEPEVVIAHAHFCRLAAMGWHCRSSSWKTDSMYVIRRDSNRNVTTSVDVRETAAEL